MLRSAVSKVMWVGRATIFMVGLVVVLFLTLAIVAQAADAARVPSLQNGVVNTVNTMTTLVGSIANPILKLDNNGTGTALQLDVQHGNAPLVVNTDAGTATNLDADKLDGKDSAHLVTDTTPTYEVNVIEAVGADGIVQTIVNCDEGDRLLSGGFADLSVGTTVLESVGRSAGSWSVEAIDNNPSNEVTIRIRCYDFPPLRP